MTVVISWVLTYLLQSTLLLGAVWVVSRLLRGRAAVLETVWRVTFLGSVVAPLLIVSGVVRPLIGSIPIWESAAVGEAVAAVAVAGEPFDAADRASEPLSASTTPALTTSTTAAVVARQKTTADASASGPVDLPAPGLGVTLWNWTPALVTAWIASACLLVAWHFVRRRRVFTLLVSREVVADPQVNRMFAELRAAARLRRDVQLTSSPACPVPMALSSSEVCVPARFLNDLDAEQQRGALAHEVAHLARRDPRWLTVDAIIGSVFFFQPLNVVARRALREEAESQCDDWAARQGAGFGLARCLADVATWLTPFPRSLLVVTIPMAANQSDLVYRVERLLTDTAGAAPIARSRPLAAACLIVAAVASAAPAFSAAPSGAGSDTLSRPEPGTVSVLNVSAVNRAAEVPEQIIRATRSGDALAARWAWALGDARGRSRRGFWVGYSFAYPLRPNQQHLSDSEGINLDRIDWDGVKLGETLGVGISDGIAIIAHYRGGADATPDRITHRSMNAPMNFGSDAVYWLGAADDNESVPWLDALQQRMPTTALRSEFVEALSMHRTSTIVLPVLERLLGSDRDAHIRAEAAEGLEHHDVPAALQLARATATRDSDRSVRAEAAEAIGEMPIAGAVDVLVELANTADDSGVRGEAAEALGSQPGADALRGIEAVVFDSPYEDARQEAIEALGELEAAAALPVLRRIIWEHPSTSARVEAVETIGDFEGVDVAGELRDLLERHPDPAVRHEALEVLAGMDTPAAYALILEIAAGAASADQRRDAIEAVAEAGEKGRSAAEIDQAATLLEHTVFNDRDESVQREAIDAVSRLPRPRALAILRKVVETHASSRIRREAIEAIAEMTRQ